MHKKQNSQPRWKRALENKNESNYHKKIEDILKKLSPQYINSIPFLLMDRRNLTKALIRIELFKKILEIPGYIIECGSYRGNGLGLLLNLSSIYEPFNYNRKIIAFDTFEGFKNVSLQDPKNASEGDLDDTDVKIIEDTINAMDFNRPIGHVKKVELIKGDACTTIPKYIKDNPHLIVSFLYLDFDIYSPTKVALENFMNLIPKGGIIAFDEFAQKKWAGETIAYKELFNIDAFELKKFNFDPHICYLIKK